MEEKKEELNMVSEEQTQSEENSQSGDVSPAKEKKNFKDEFLKFFSATRIAYMAIFTALSYILYMPWLEFWIIPAVDFLKIDFSNTFVMIAGFSLGPVAGVIVGVLKELLHALTFSSTVGVGELANILLLLPYVLIPSVAYKKYKGIKSVIIMLVIACLAQTACSFPINYLINFPFFLQSFKGGTSFFMDVWYWVILFNFVKTVLISLAVMLIYKPLSRLIKLTNAKFARKKDKLK